MDRIKYHISVFSVIVIVLMTLGEAVRAENIDPDSTGCKYAWSENTGWINFKPSQGDGVTVTDTAVTGMAWGENIGWINLSPANYGGVVNKDGTGNLEGYAWGENVGWINFKPVNGGVTIGSNGTFTGYAWGENIGWINFSSPNSCVKTAWLAPPPNIIPNPFAFINQTGIALNALVTSNTITVTGINAPSPISINGGQYSINNGVYTSATGTVHNGDSVNVQLTSSATYTTTTNATLTIGGVSATFSVTTINILTAQSITFSVSPSIVTYGISPIALVATASSGLPVTFTVVSGPGSMSVNTLTVTGVGSIVIEADQAGDSTQAAATPVQQTLIVNQATPVIAWSTPAAINYGTGLSSAQLNATASVAGTFAYTPAAGAVLSAGSQTLSVTFTPPDNTDYATATTQASLTVNQASTSTTVVSSVNPSLHGQSVTFAATVSAVSPGSGTPTGMVTFYDGTTSLGTYALDAYGYVYLVTSTLDIGSHSITAQYSGDTNFLGSQSSPALVQGVLVNHSTTALISSVNPSMLGQSVTFTATVSVAPGNGTPTGIVTFYDGTTSLGTNALSAAGNAHLVTSTLGSGSHSITAQYAGDTIFLGSQSSPALVQGVIGNPSMTALVSSVNPLVSGQSVTFTATVSAVSPGGGTPTGMVTFYDGPTQLAQVALDSSGHAAYATSSLSPGSHGISASYSGDATFNVSTTSGMLTETVTSAIAQSITFAVSPSIVIYGISPIALVATASSGLPVTFVVVSGPGSLSGNTLTVTGAGSIVIESNQAGNSSYTAANPVRQTLTVNPAVLTVTANNATRLYGQANPTFTGTITGLQNGDNITATYLSTSTPSISVGTYPITPTLVDPSGKLGNYAVTLNNGTLTVSTAPLTVTANDATRIYGQTNPAFTGTITGLQNSDNITATYSTAATSASNVGSYPIIPALVASGGKLGNYALKLNNGTLKILYASAGNCDGDVGHQILQPVNADGTSVWKQGRTIPLKFRVCDANGVSIGSPGVIKNFTLAQIISGTVANVDETVDAAVADSGFRFDPAAQQWIFNLSTSGQSAGYTYVYSINLNDGSAINFQYGLR